MRLMRPAVTLAVIALLLLLAPAASSRPGLDDAQLVTALRPYETSVVVGQDAEVSIYVEIVDGAYTGILAKLETGCYSEEALAAHAAPAPSGDDERPAAAVLLLKCGEMEPGRYDLTVSVEGGAARVRFSSTNANVR